MYRKKLRIIALCALVVCLVLAFLIWRSFDKYVFEDAGFYPVGSMKYPVNVGDTAQQHKDETYAMLQLGDLDEISGADACVYVADRDAVILTSTMCIIPKPVDGSLSFYKIPAFTDVQRNINNLFITSKTHQYLGDSILLYNGSDTYIVLENATLTIGDENIVLSPLSYVIACKDQWVQYYDYSRDTFGLKQIEQDTPVEITMKNWNLKIDAARDKGSYEGQEFMFFTSVAFFDDFFNHYY